MKERFQNNYDFLRVFAALCIIYAHSFGLLGLGNEEGVRTLTRGRFGAAFIGLILFFSISGFLIAKSALQSTSFLNYLWKRFLRIQPLLIVVCLLSIFILGLFYSSLPPSEYFSTPQTWSYLRNVFPVFGVQFSLPGVFEQNPFDQGVNGSLWTLIVEERLYLVICLLFLFRTKPVRYFLLLILTLNLLYLINHLFFHGNLIPYLHQSSTFYAFIFLNSSAFYLSQIDIKKHHRWLSIAGLLLFLAATLFPSLDFLYLYACPVLVNSLAHFKGALNKTGTYGDFTYGLYIFAFPVQNALIASETTTNPHFLFLMTLCIVFPCAVLSWHLVEKRSIQLRNRVS